MSHPAEEAWKRDFDAHFEIAAAPVPVIPSKVPICDRCGALLHPDFIFTHTSWHDTHGESAGIEWTAPAL